MRRYPRSKVKSLDLNSEIEFFELQNKGSDEQINVRQALFDLWRLNDANRDALHLQKISFAIMCSNDCFLRVRRGTPESIRTSGARSFEL